MNKIPSLEDHFQSSQGFDFVVLGQWVRDGGRCKGHDLWLSWKYRNVSLWESWSHERESDLQYYIIYIYIHNTYKLYMIVIYDYDTHIHIYNHMYILIVLPQILIPEGIVPTLLGWLWLIHCFLQGWHWKGLPLPLPFVGFQSSRLECCPSQIQRLPRAGAPPKSIWQTKRRLAVTLIAFGECRKSIANWTGCHSRRWDENFIIPFDWLIKLADAKFLMFFLMIRIRTQNSF